MNQVDFAIRTIVEGSPVICELLEKKFNMFVVSKDQLQENLKASGNHFKLKPGDEVNMFVLFIRIDA